MFAIGCRLHCFQEKTGIQKCPRPKYKCLLEKNANSRYPLALFTVFPYSTVSSELLYLLC